MVHTRHLCKKITCGIGLVSGLVLFIIGISSLPQRSSITLQQGQTIDDSNREYNSLVLHSSGFYIMISGISIVIILFMCILYIIKLQEREELIELERSNTPIRSALRVTRVLPVPEVPKVPEAPKVPEVPKVQIHELSVPHKGPVIQVLKKFRYPPPYEAFNRK
jgi:hypothetical protein